MSYHYSGTWAMMIMGHLVVRRGLEIRTFLIYATGYEIREINRELVSLSESSRYNLSLTMSKDGDTANGYKRLPRALIFFLNYENTNLTTASSMQTLSFIISWTP